MRLPKIAREFDAGRLPPGAPPPRDIFKLFNYRREIFSLPFNRAMEAAMRGPSEWSVGERELMAAYVSRQNTCRYCTTAHSAVASLALADASLVSAVLADLETAPIAEPLRATLRLLASLTIEPSRVDPHAIDAVRAQGVSDQAIADALFVCALFNIINRCADALDFEVPAVYPGNQLLELGYLRILGESSAPQ